MLTLRTVALLVARVQILLRFCSLLQSDVGQIASAETRRQRRARWRDNGWAGVSVVVMALLSHQPGAAETGGSTQTGLVKRGGWSGRSGRSGVSIVGARLSSAPIAPMSGSIPNRRRADEPGHHHSTRWCHSREGVRCVCVIKRKAALSQQMRWSGPAFNANAFNKAAHLRKRKAPATDQNAVFLAASTNHSKAGVSGCARLIALLVRGDGIYRRGSSHE